MYKKNQHSSRPEVNNDAHSDLLTSPSMLPQTFLKTSQNPNLQRPCIEQPMNVGAHPLARARKPSSATVNLKPWKMPLYLVGSTCTYYMANLLTQLRMYTATNHIDQVLSNAVCTASLHNKFQGKYNIKLCVTIHYYELPSSTHRSTCKINECHEIKNFYSQIVHI